MNVDLEIATLFPSTFSRVKKGGNFRTNINLVSFESFLYHLSSSYWNTVQPVTGWVVRTRVINVVFQHQSHSAKRRWINNKDSAFFTDPFTASFSILSTSVCLASIILFNFWLRQDPVRQCRKNVRLFLICWTPARTTVSDLFLMHQIFFGLSLWTTYSKFLMLCKKVYNWLCGPAFSKVAPG